MNRHNIKLDELKDYLGFGVAGNFANHLGEAGEADEFSVIKTDEKDAPKGLFPFYIPNHDSFLAQFPICTDEINHNDIEHLQVEAEVGLICDFVYENDKLVDLKPKYFGAFNDCSNRIQDGNKLSTKKNWGKGSKGIAHDFIEIDSFEEDGILNKFHIASFIRRDGILRDYGTVSAVRSYSYFFNQLKTWMIDKFNTQEDLGPLEELPPFLKDINKHKGLLIAAGATAYTEFGKHHFLEKGDEIFIYVYNAHFHSFEDIMQDMAGSDVFLSQCSKLHQIVK
ncbi:MAG: DUF5718 family protein [Arcobacter sp.]|uniref:DUF5718 family protein n=1 Tax=Arcobacter sp. TaxID=1872629 RepID=UPI003B000586